MGSVLGIATPPPTLHQRRDGWVGGGGGRGGGAGGEESALSGPGRKAGRPDGSLPPATASALLAADDVAGRVAVKRALATWRRRAQGATTSYVAYSAAYYN